MMKRLTLAFGMSLGLVGSLGATSLDRTFQKAPEKGRFLEYDHVQAAGLPDQRMTIWLPPGYDQSAARYPVIYMHDGHNLFDPAKSNFNKVWKADQALLALTRAKRVPPHIIIGIWAPGKDRYRQYLPQPLYTAAPPELRRKMDDMAGGPIVSNLYLTWITQTLKPWVDQNFKTIPGPAATSIAGSSMGGLMSCYAFLARPDIFGQAACVSTHWPLVDPRLIGPTDPDVLSLLTGWFRKGLGSAENRKLWMDHGTATLDAFYPPYQQAVDAEIRRAKWDFGRNVQSKAYPGAEHEENAWASRLPEIFDWLLRDAQKTNHKPSP